MIEYRKATAADVEDIIPLMTELGYEHTVESLTANFMSVEDAGGSIFVAVSESKVLGCICAILDCRLAAGSCGELVSVVVLPDCQGKGIGKGLILTAENWLKSKVGKIRIRANVIRDNAHQFYQGLGYAEIKSQKIFTKSV